MEHPHCEHCEKGGHLYIHSRCHTDCATWTSIDFVKRRIIVECAKCNKIIVQLRLSEEDYEGFATCFEA